MEVESICGPCAEANQKVCPVLGIKLREEADRVLQWSRCLPFRVLFAEVVCDDNSLLPDEEVFPALLGCGEGALSQRVRRVIAGSHDELEIGKKDCYKW